MVFLRFLCLDRLYSKNVPFIGMRMFAAACGIGLVPISYLTMKRSGHSTQASMICAIFVTFGKPKGCLHRLLRAREHDNASPCMSCRIHTNQFCFLFCSHVFYKKHKRERDDYSESIYPSGRANDVVYGLHDARLDQLL